MENRKPTKDETRPERKTDDRTPTPPAKYEAPRIISHSGEQILEQLGPAQACYPF